MHRYVGRKRNAGWGYPLHLRLRRQAAFWCLERGLYRLGYLIDFDRDRYLEEYGPLGMEQLEGREAWVEIALLEEDVV